MQKHQNPTNQTQTNSVNNTDLVQRATADTTSFNISGNITAQGGHVLAGNNQFGNNANFSVNNSQSRLNQSVLPVTTNNMSKPTEQSEIDEEGKQPVENNPLEPTLGEGCCSLKIGKLGCGSVISFWCFSLEPSAEDVYLVCCPKGSKEQEQQAMKEADSTNNQTQYQSVSQMEAQIQVDPK